MTNACLLWYMRYHKYAKVVVASSKGFFLNAQFQPKVKNYHANFNYVT